MPEIQPQFAEMTFTIRHCFKSQHATFMASNNGLTTSMSIRKLTTNHHNWDAHTTNASFFPRYCHYKLSIMLQCGGSISFRHFFNETTVKYGTWIQFLLEIFGCRGERFLSLPITQMIFPHSTFADLSCKVPDLTELWWRRALLVL